MAEEQLKILRIMNEIKGKIGLKEFSKTACLNPGRTLEYVQELVKADFVRKVGRGYAITEKGKIALKALNSVPGGMEFRFYTGIGRDTGLSAKSLKDFRELIRKVDVEALEFHVFRRDFEGWIKTAFDDAQLANELIRIRESALKGETLRNEIVKATEARFSEFEKLLSS